MPFGPYVDFNDCVERNQNRDDPAAYCAAIQQQVEGEKAKECNSRIIFEHLVERVSEKKIKGIAAYPGISRNKNLYLPEELERAHGLTVPMYWNHDYSQAPIGEARFNWDPVEQLLRYEADVDPNYKADYVSISTSVNNGEIFNGYFVPRGVHFDELSLVPNPGFPLTSVIAAESANKRRIVIESYVPSKEDLTVTVAPSAGSDIAEGVTLHQSSDTSSLTQVGEVGRDGVRGEIAGKQTVEASPIKKEKAKEKLVQTIEEVKKEEASKSPKHENPPSYLTKEEFLAAHEKLLEKISGMRPEKEKPKEEGRAQVSVQEAKVGESAEDRRRKLYESVAAAIRRSTEGGDVPLGYSWRVPIIQLPRGVDARLKWIEDYQVKVNVLKTTEALATTTTGASLGVFGVSPTLVIPFELIGNTIDLVNFVEVPPGADRARFATIKVAAAGALTENTEPTEATQTLTAPEATPSQRGIQQSVSYELEKKMVANVIEAVVESFRLSHLIDVDSLVETEARGATPAATLYGDESVSAEASITSAMTFAPARVASAVRKVEEKGYSPDNYVLVVHPKQYTDLLKHADIRQAHIFGEKVQVTGVIPSLYGVEVRQMTKMTTGTGSGTTTTYRAFMCKRGVTFGLGSSRDILVETFRDIRKNQTVIKASWDIAVKAIEPDSFVKIITA